MTKKILLGLFILLMGAVCIVAYNFYKNAKQPVSNNSIIAVPQNAALILQEKNFNAVYTKIASTNIMWEELVQNTTSAKEMNLKMAFLDSLLQLPSLKNVVQKKSILASMHLSGANNFDFIFYLSIPTNITEVELLQKIKTITNANPETRAYDGVNIHTIIDNKKKKLAFSCYKNILSFSYSTVLIEDVIRQLNTDNSLLNNPNFSQVFNTSGEAIDGNLYINNSYFPKILGQYVNSDSKKSLQQFEHYANWTELDMSIKSNSIMFNGFTHSSDSSNNFLNLFKNQDPQSIEMTSIIPANTALFYYYSFSDSKQFFEDRKGLLKSKNAFFNYQKFIDEYSDSYGVDLEEEFIANIGNELAFVITEPLADDYENNKFVIFQSNNIDEAIENLNQLALKINEEPTPITEFKERTISQIGLKNVFQQLIGDPFINLKNPYYTAIDDYIIFGSSESAIKTIINDYSFEKTLEKNDNFQSFNDNLSSKANIFIYNNIARSVNLYKAYAKESFLPIIDEKIEFFRKFEALAFQVISDKNNFYYNNIYFKYNPIYKQDTRTLWETKLDTTVSAKPEIVKNHKTNAKEVFVQDDANKIYLISNTGKILWSKQLAEKIIGKTHQIDVYKNNKFQLLFNTKSKIYLLDRNGKNVSAFPIQLKARATNAVTPLDYEGSRNYRLLIGCDNNMVYNYTTEGKLVNGWEYSSTDSPATSNIWHFQQSGKDYIVIPLQNGSIKVIQRNGKDRLQLTHKLPVSKNQVYLSKGIDLKSTAVLTADSTGTITKVYLSGNSETIKIESMVNHTFNFFDVNNDQFSDYVFSSDNTLKVINNDKTILFETEFDQVITSNPLSFKMLDKTKRIGVATTSEIYLFNSFGSLEPDFPLTGSTPFSIGDINNDNVLNLVVGDKNRIYTYNLK
jgi:signal peptidase I